MAEKFKKAIQALSLQEFVRLLNDGFNPERRFHREAHANLLLLVQSWQQARDVHAPKHSFEKEHGAPIPTWFKMKLPPGCPSLASIQKRCEVILGPAGTGLYPAINYVVFDKENPSAWDDAVRLFIHLLTNPDRDKLGGPCDRCKKHYVKKRASQKSYCSRRCGNAATAIIRTREKWDETRAEKLERAKKASEKWSELKTRVPWKEYVCSKHPDLTPKFLTRAVNQGELAQPKRS